MRYPVAHELGTAEECRAAFTRRLVEYWNVRTPAGAAMPAWADIELMDLYKIAHCIVVKDVLAGDRDFVNRFWGSELTNVFGFEGTGLRVSNYEPESLRENSMKRFAAVAGGTTAAVRGELESHGEGKWLRFELVHLPLAGTGDPGRVGHIISVYDFAYLADDPS